MHEKWGVFSSSFLRFHLPTALPEGEDEETNSDTCAGNSEGKKEGRKDRKTPEIGKAITRSDGMCAWLKN